MKYNDNNKYRRRWHRRWRMKKDSPKYYHKWLRVADYLDTITKINNYKTYPFSIRIFKFIIKQKHKNALITNSDSART